MDKFPKISIEIIPITEQRFTTIGDWTQLSDGSFKVWLSEMNDWRHVALVFLHEFTELFICWKNNVSATEADAFDKIWEDELKRGLHKSEQEAGFDRRCPYRKGHVWGTRMERLFSFLLGVKWSKYVDECNLLSNTYTQKYT